MPKRRWNNKVPANLRQALEWTKDYAREIHNKSVEGIAVEMGLADHWTLYKWINNGRMPAVSIPNFESVCGINYVSRWLACHGGNMVVKMPTGKKAQAEDVMALQSQSADAVAALLRFYNGLTDTDETLAQVQIAMEGFSHHHKNVQQFKTPQLDLSAQEDEL